MPSVSEEELQQLRKDNEKLRDSIANAATKKAENDAARQREYEALQLQAENARLEGELAAANEAAKVGNSKSGAANVLEAAQKQLEAAEAVALSTPGVPVDTNVENPPKGTTGATVAVETKTDDKVNTNGGNS